MVAILIALRVAGTGKIVPKWHRRVLVALMLVFLAPSPGRTQARNVAPQPLGTLVDVGGYRVHLYCVGSGNPTVVITGAGYSFDWGLVQPEVAKLARVCAYDHSGVAWSEPGPTDTCSLRVGEIHSALKNAGILGPYVLVGHSLGALVSRLYASTYETEVAGMVIVEHATGSLLAKSKAPGDAFPQGKLPTPVRKPDLNAGFEKLPERDYQLHVWANSQPGIPQIIDKNSQIATECSTQVDSATKNQASPLSDKPLIAISVQATQLLHAQLLSLSSNSKQLIAVHTGHYVMVDRPDVVIGAIREVIEAAQNHTKLKR
jgi:pimeloyl-ACP methyl ester carboxylesterase